MSKIETVTRGYQGTPDKFLVFVVHKRVACGSVPRSETELSGVSPLSVCEILSRVLASIAFVCTKRKLYARDEPLEPPTDPTTDVVHG